MTDLQYQIADYILTRCVNESRVHLTDVAEGFCQQSEAKLTEVHNVANYLYSYNYIKRDKSMLYPTERGYAAAKKGVFRFEKRKMLNKILWRAWRLLIDACVIGSFILAIILKLNA